MNYKKEDYNHMAHLRKLALVEIAQQLGKEHTITRLMGSMAYGRNNAEQGPEGNLQSAIREMSFLDGCFHVLNTWARDNDPKAQLLMRSYPHGFSKRQ